MKMKFVNIFLIFIVSCHTTNADIISNIPVVGGVLGSLNNASQNALNFTVYSIQNVGGELLNTNSITDTLKEHFRKLIEDFRKLMSEELELLDIPRLEPLEIEQINIEFEHEIGEIYGWMKDVKIYHLSKFQVCALDVSILTLLDPSPNISLKLHFDEIEIEGGLYNISAYIGELFDIWGCGPFNVTIRGVDVDIDVLFIFSIAKKVIFIDNLSINLHVENVTTNFENLLGGGDNEVLLNNVMGRLAPETINTIWPEVKPGIERQIKEMVMIHLIPKRIRKISKLFHIDFSPILNLFGIH